MSPSSPLSPPKTTSSTTSPRRLVKPLKSWSDWEHERHERLSQARAFRHQRQARLLMGIAAACLILGATVYSASRFFSPSRQWPKGQALNTGLVVAQAPVVVGGNWLFPASNGTLWSVRGGQTRQIWSSDFPSSPRVVPVDKNLLVVGGDGTMSCLGERNQTLWKAANGAGVSSRPAVSSGFLVGADDARTLWARHLQDGRLLWRVATSAPAGDGLTATPWGVVVPLLGGDKNRGGLRCVSPQTGHTLWKFPLSSRQRAGGTAIPRFEAASGRLFWCNDEGTVFAVDARTGRKIWKSFVGSRTANSPKNTVLLRASPVIVGDALVVGGSDGGLRAFDLRDGHPLWTRWLDQPLATPLQKGRINGRVVVLAGSEPVVAVDAQDGHIVQRMGEGTVAWNGEFAAGDSRGVWHFWR